jgi:hypothetical protein
MLQDRSRVSEIANAVSRPVMQSRIVIACTISAGSGILGGVVIAAGSAAEEA